MKARRFFEKSLRRIRRDEMEGVRDVFYDLYSGFLCTRLSKLSNGGFRIFTEDWDILVILDACRVDVLRATADEYEFLPPVRSRHSAGSNSEEWLEKNFTSKFSSEMERTAYVTGNVFSQKYFDQTDFACLDEVWRYAWDHELGTVPAEPMTDRAIHHWRTGEYDRMIVHYMQPHFPSVPRPEFDTGIDLNRTGQQWNSVWQQLRKGQVSKETVWDAYQENLRYVLESLDLLVSSVDAENVVVSSDHANSFGTWGLYGHPRAPVAVLRTVPWCELSARNTTNYAPSVVEKDAPVSEDVESKLRNLGYVS